MIKKLSQLRDEYLIGIIMQFEVSGKNQTIDNCYNYVIEVKNETIYDFINNLNSGNREIILSDITSWFNPINSINEFEIFLKNNEITI